MWTTCFVDGDEEYFWVEEGQITIVFMELKRNRHTLFEDVIYYRPQGIENGFFEAIFRNGSNGSSRNLTSDST
jgi:hypothetical protein